MEGFCEFCQTETPCGHITDAQGERDLFGYEFDFLGEKLKIGAGITLDELEFFNFDYNRFAAIRINYCPMCGRKLEHWAEEPADNESSQQP